MTRTLRILLSMLIGAAMMPGPVHAAEGRLATLDAAMAPLLEQYQPAFDAIVADFTTMSQPSAPYDFTTVEAAATAMQSRIESAEGQLDAAKKLPKDIDYAIQLAEDALSVIDENPAEACWADYAAVLRTGWLLYLDSADSLRVSAMDDANKYVGAALALLGAYGTLIHDKSVADCAAPA